MRATPILPLVYADADSASVSRPPGNVRAHNTNAKIIGPINKDLIESLHGSSRIKNQHGLFPVPYGEAAARDLQCLFHPQNFLASSAIDQSPGSVTLTQRNHG